jgi:putative FmdB family regulatory protein
MPLYEYQCAKCGVRFERLQRKGDPAVEECPECKGTVRRLIQPPGIIFKGSGFYVTDNRRPSSRSRRSDAEKSSVSKDSPTDKKEKSDSD